MTDIVKRLRMEKRYMPTFLAEEAADEIERLRERVADLQAEIGYTESIKALTGREGGK